MTFEDTFNILLAEDIGSTQKLAPYKRKIDRGQNRKKNLRWVPTSHRTDPTANTKIERLRKKAHGKEMCDINDLIHIINNYILQGPEEQCDQANVHDLAKKYLSGNKGKSLGKSGIIVQLEPLTKSYILKK